MLYTDLCNSLCTVIIDKMGLLMAYRRVQRNEQETLHLPAVSCLPTNVASLTTNSTSHWLSIALMRKVICDMSREQMQTFLCGNLLLRICCHRVIYYVCIHASVRWVSVSSYFFRLLKGGITEKV